ncbi:DUF2806 domain-containing protein [Candidatus Gracilibacteria bacterium]|nr:DUF2806 domain-containing protein [Candidatus Gracilibacteria bacterium]
MFGVLDKAIQKVKGNAQGNIDTDKIKRLKDLSKDFSSDEMQEVIAGILAGEYNQSGTFSLKTMDIVRSLSRDELNIFRKFCGLVINKDFIFGNFYASGNKNLTKLYTKGIGYDNYLYLQELGLITGSNSSQELGDETGINYNYGFIISDKLLTLKLNKKISLNNKSILTKAGKEFYSLINPIFDEDLFNMSKEELIRQGFEEIK